MKAQLKVRLNLIIELEGEKQKDLFRAIASAMEVFAEKRCGKCRSSDVQFRVRKNRDEQEFFELVCLHCHAVLEYGQHKTGGTLFPRRRAGEGEESRFLPDQGWLKWDAERKENV